MTKSAVTTAAVSAPSIGPTVLIVFGVQVPVAAMALSLVGLILARYIAPRSARKLSLGQERALTVLLALLLVVIVSGNAPYVGTGEPLDVGMATAWGVGLGTSGLLTVEFIGGRIMGALRAMFSPPAEK